MMITVNGEVFDLSRYGSLHDRRFEMTLDVVRRLGAGTIIEVGAYPWAMTTRLLREPGVRLLATVSAEEITAWPDEIPVRAAPYALEFGDGQRAEFTNYSANVERTLFPVRERADIVLACEIIEHLTRAPHVMMLNINSWLKPGGRVVLTTPNGAQFDNPLRVKPKMPALRYSTYSRHNVLFTLDTLTDLVRTCGFSIERAEYWSPYRRRGASNLRHLLARLPSRYFRDKFAQTIVVVARKVEERSEASRLPKAYEPSAQWERMAGAPASAQAQRAIEPDAVE
jgi:hypothetical protein